MPNLCCEAPGCARAAKNRRLCWAHYKRMRKYGTFNLPTVMDRITDAAGYRTWLKTAVRDEVQRRTVRQLDEEHNAAKAAALEALAGELPAPDPAAT